MEENKNKKAPNLVLAVVCVVLILVFGVGAAICIVNLKQGKYNNAEPSKENKIVNVEVEDEEDIEEEDANLEEPEEEEIDEDLAPNETEILEENDELAEVKDVIDTFVKAVNEKDWDEIEAISSQYVVDTLKKYEVKNISVDTSKIERNPNRDGYMTISHYDFSYQGMSAKDLGLGNIFTIEKANDKYVISDFCATGP